MQKDRMLLVSQNKLSILIKSFEKYHQVPSYRRCRDLLNAKRANFEENLIANKRNKFARDIADYEKGKIFQWGKGRSKAHNVGDPQGPSEDTQVPPPHNYINRPQQQMHKGGGPHKEANKDHLRQKTPVHSTQRPRHNISNNNSRGRDLRSLIKILTMTHISKD